MPTFNFIATDARGRKRHGEIESSSRESAVAKLRRSALADIEIQETVEFVVRDEHVEVDVDDDTEPKKQTIIDTKKVKKKYEPRYGHLSGWSEVFSVFSFLMILGGIILIVLMSEIGVLPGLSCLASGLAFLFNAQLLKGLLALCISTERTADSILEIRVDMISLAQEWRDSLKVDNE